MLKELNIKNFAIIDDLKIEFFNGLSVLTGETGAGKSIIIDALEFVLGARTGANTIKHEQDKATVEALFDISKVPDFSLKLDSFDIEYTENELLVKRTFLRSGKNRCFINGSMINLTSLKDITNFLVDIHGQHEHQSLLNRSTHVEILDTCTGLTEISNSLRKKYNTFTQKLSELNRLISLDKEKSDQIEFLRFKIEDISKANLVENEEDELIANKNILSNAKDLFTCSRGGYDEIYVKDDAVIVKLKAILQEIKDASITDAKLKKYEESIQTAIFELEESALGLRDYSSSIEFNPMKLEEIESRLFGISSLKRKYSRSKVSELITLKETAENELLTFTSNKELIENLKNEIELLKEDLKTDSFILAKKREKNAVTVEIQMEKELLELNMKDVQFKVSFIYDECNNNQQSEILSDTVLYNEIPVKLTQNGIGTTEFLFSSNKGVPLAPLIKIASGGEISRVMLVLKKILSDKDKVPTMVFDEIDTGTSGSTAELIGEKLRFTAKFHQILCITHLPQIAGKAGNHYMIYKDSSKGNTQIIVKKLDNDERVRELARMSGGRVITETTLKHAREMINEVIPQNV